MLASVAVVCSVSLVASFASIPQQNLYAVVYLDTSCWVVGPLLWIVSIWAVAEVVIAVTQRRPTSIRRVFRQGRQRDRRTSGARRVGLAPSLIGGVALVVSVALVVFPIQALANPSSRLQVYWPGVAAVDRAAPAIEREIPRGRVWMTFNSPGLSAEDKTSILLGLAWRLISDGWQPGLPDYVASTIALDVPTHGLWPTVVITINDQKVVSVVRTTAERPIGSG